MTEPRPPIHPAPGDWPDVRDHYAELAAERDRLLVDRDALIKNRDEWTSRYIAELAKFESDNDRLRAALKKAEARFNKAVIAGIEVGQERDAAIARADKLCEALNEMASTFWNDLRPDSKLGRKVYAALAAARNEGGE